MQHQVDIDIASLRLAHGLLQVMSTEARLLQLKALVVNNGGIWTVPDEPHHVPVLYEVALFGVPAFADRADDLPVSWMRAAANILDRHSEGAAA